MINKEFEITSGSISGTHHVLSGTNNHDSHTFKTQSDFAIALACDGCGSGEKSEIGSNIGIQMICKEISARMHNLLITDGEVSTETMKRMLDTVQQSVSWKIGNLIENMGSERSFHCNAINHFLFTVLGALITKKRTFLFSIGDGIFILNNEEIHLGPFPNNAPPYFIYDSVLKVAKNSDEDYKFQIIRSIPTYELENLMIGTDGVSDLINKKDYCIPGKKNSVGEISQFFDNDYFSNQDLLRRKLAAINKPCDIIDWDSKRRQHFPGLLHDDTTLICIKRRNL